MGKLISTMVKHSVRVLCKWVVIRSSVFIRGAPEAAPTPGALVNIMAMKHPMAKPEKLSLFFFFFESLYLVVTTDLIWGLLSLFLSSLHCFLKCLWVGILGSHRAESSSSLLSGLKQI